MDQTPPPPAASDAPTPTPVYHERAEHADAHDVSKHVKKYLMVGALLLTFTVITVALSYLDFGNSKVNMTVAMLVAAFKAGLVAAIFMHLSAEKRLIYRVLLFTAFFVFALFWLTYLHWYDPVTR